MKRTLIFILTFIFFMSSVFIFGDILKTVAVVDAENYNDPELDLSLLTMDDLLSMSNDEYLALVKEFERVYDPFDTYEELLSNEEITLEMGEIPNDNIVNPNWTSGDYDAGEYTEQGTHELITATACVIMQNDRGFYSNNDTAKIGIALSISLASLLPDRYLSETDVAFQGHFYSPATGKNYAGGSSNTAPKNAKSHYNKAVAAAEDGDMAEAYKNLGMCLHYVQDINVPHHATNVTTIDSSTHKSFEAYAEEHFDDYMDNYTSVGVNNYDYYPANYTVEGIVKLAARYSFQRIGYVADPNYTAKWDEQASVALRNAARYSVMVMYKFGKESAVPFYNN